jgi:hypothetical protein
MKREPVYVGDRLTGHNVHYPPAYIKVRDMRGYDSIMQVQPARVVFEPVARQRGIFDEED